MNKNKVGKSDNMEENTGGMTGSICRTQRESVRMKLPAKYTLIMGRRIYKLK
jgi:hypothetical protein